MVAQWAKLAAVIAAGPFPTLSRITTQGPIDFDLDALFEFGLQRMLDGLTLFLGSRGR
jgi:Tetracyclin repressor-like, C-terminal domain